VFMQGKCSAWAAIGTYLYMRSAAAPSLRVGSGCLQTSSCGSATDIPYTVPSFSQPVVPASRWTVDFAPRKHALAQSTFRLYTRAVLFWASLPAPSHFQPLAPVVAYGWIPHNAGFSFLYSHSVALTGAKPLLRPSQRSCHALPGYATPTNRSDLIFMNSH
jgi:hypothetical protein